MLDLAASSATCPAGQTTQDFRPSPAGGGQFRFAAAVCAACPLRAQCVRGASGRTVAVHPQERLLQEARALQASPAFTEYRRRRQMVEHRIARLVQLGIRQARDVGTPKVLFQLLMAAAVANLTYLAASASQPTDQESAASWAACCALRAAPGRPEPPPGPQMARRGSRHPQRRPSVVTPSTAHTAADRVRQPRFLAGSSVLPQGRALGKVSIVQSAGYETTDLCTRVDEG